MGDLNGECSAVQAAGFRFKLRLVRPDIRSHRNLRTGIQDWKGRGISECQDFTMVVVKFGFRALWNRSGERLTYEKGLAGTCVLFLVHIISHFTERGRVPHPSGPSITISALLNREGRWG